jgi:hypothetical protein
MQCRLNFHTRWVFVACFFILHAWGTSGQAGTAPSGYYPTGYSGDMFRGTVSQTTDDTITLNYVHGSETEIFEAHADAPCHLPASKSGTSPMPLTKVPIGSLIEIFYEAKTIKVGGVKQKENQIVGLAFLQTKVNGQWVAMKSKVIFYCTPIPDYTSFMAF